MKILLINKFYYLAGGRERYLFAWEKMLREYGHDVMVFSMSHPRNRPCAQSKYFIKNVSFDADQSPFAKLRTAAHALWSAEARRKLEALLQAEDPPDIAHVRSYLFQLTPSILKPLKQRNIPIVQSCPDYAPICVNQHLYNDRTHALCEACLRNGQLAPLRQRCMKGSFTASAAGCLAGFVDRRLVGSRRRIDRYVASSAFMRNKLIEGGLPRERVAHVPHFINAKDIEPAEGTGEYMLFFGRLVPQKGIRTFLEAAARLPRVPCKVLGGGPLEAEVRARIAERNLNHVTCLGHCEGDALWKTVRHARAVVVPSEWYEPFGLVILEAMAASRPVIATTLAGPGEIVTDGEDGLLVPPRDPEALAQAMERLWSDAALARELGQRGRERVVVEYAPDVHYRRLMRLFEEVLR